MFARPGGMVHDVAVILMAQVVVVGIVAATLLAHIGQQEIGCGVIDVRTDAEDRRSRSVANDVIGAGRLKPGEIEPPGTGKCPFRGVRGTALSLEDSFVGEGVTDFKNTRRSGILRDGHCNFQIIGQIARQVDTHPGLLRTERQEGQERNKQKEQSFHLVFQSYLGIWAP